VYCQLERRGAGLSGPGLVTAVSDLGLSCVWTPFVQMRWLDTPTPSPTS
jgi:hypothetical protein